ncbi:MAG TPA: DUF4973 domain-containing protein [Candidatus Phocaeicola gallinarum]|nr:DUF4973 domain-containing protein [Candidatus Phocaeicola gallinarum]
MKKIFYLIILLTSFGFVSCNNEWEDEQYEQYVSFKAPVGSNGVTDIYIRYKKDGKVTYQLPVIVSGSTFNAKDMNVKIELDSDTLSILNDERFGREDLYYLELTPEHYSFPEEINMPQGTSVVTLPIDFDLTGINMVRNWVLPLTIVDKPGVYLGHPRKNYAKALLNIKPFNDYSGTYSTTTLQSFIANADGSYDQANPIVRNTRTGQVVDENTIFFYAGAMEEDLINREDYKVNFYFNPETEMVELSSDNESLKLEQLNKDQSVYTIAEVPDQERPYLIHRYVIFNIEYTFVDYTSVKGTEIAYHVKGTMSLERKINTQIPDEDQAIEW